MTEHLFSDLTESSRDILHERNLLQKRDEQIAEQISLQLFPEQRRFVLDKAKQKAALCSRRAGKSFGLCAQLLLAALSEAGVTCVYIALTRNTAKRILWPELFLANARFGVGGQFNHTELTVRLPNGSEIWLTGASDADDIEKLRGQKYKIVVVDECASFGGFFGSMVEEVIEPALIDQQGSLVLAGTPGAACIGFFYNVTQRGSTWNTHRWTIMENPHIPHARIYLAQKKKEKAWQDDHPIYLREWCGQWVHSSDSLVYKYDPIRNSIADDLPSCEYVLGVDLGTNDAFVVSVLGFSVESKEAFIVDEFCQSGMIPDAWEEKIRQLQEQYQPIATVVDAGALGKAIVENFQSHGLVCEAADKTKKAAYVELLNGELISGKLKIQKGLKVCDEMRLLQWDPDRPGKEDERFANNCCDAALYAFRKCYHWLSPDPVQLPAAGSQEAYAQESARMMERRMRDIRKSLRPMHEQWEDVDDVELFQFR